MDHLEMSDRKELCSLIWTYAELELRVYNDIDQVTVHNDRHTSADAANLVHNVGRI